MGSRLSGRRGPKDITGRSFNRLTAVRCTGRQVGLNYVWLFRCLCGNEVERQAGNVIKGMTKSCGCLNRERLSRNNLYKHGQSKEKAYLRELAGRRRRLEARDYPINANAVVGHVNDLGNRCVYCGKGFEHLDHINPLSRGGRHTLKNLAPACARCNLSKRDKRVGLEWQPRSWFAIIRFGYELVAESAP